MPGYDPEGMQYQNAPSGSPYCAPAFSEYQERLIEDDLLDYGEFKHSLAALLEKAETLRDSVNFPNACDFNEVIDSLIYAGENLPSCARIEAVAYEEGTQ